MYKNVYRFDGQSFLDFVLTYKGDISKMFDILTECKFTSNQEYFESTIKKYRIDVLNNVVTESLPIGGVATDSGVILDGDFNCDFNNDFLNGLNCTGSTPPIYSDYYISSSSNIIGHLTSNDMLCSKIGTTLQLTTDIDLDWSEGDIVYFNPDYTHDITYQTSILNISGKEIILSGGSWVTPLSLGGLERCALLSGFKSATYSDLYNNDQTESINYVIIGQDLTSIYPEGTRMRLTVDPEISGSTSLPNQYYYDIVSNVELSKGNTIITPYITCSYYQEIIQIEKIYLVQV